MSSLGPDSTLVNEPARSELDGATDLSAAPLWAAFRDRYTRVKERRPPPPADGRDNVGPPLESAPITGREVFCCI